MSDIATPNQVSQKAFEISYALFRIAGSSDRQSFREYLESAALSLLTNAISGNTSRLRKDIEVAEYLVRIAGDVAIVHPANIEIIVKELNNLSSAIAESDMSEKLPDLHLDELFAKKVRQRQKNIKYDVKKAEVAVAESEPSTILEETPQEEVDVIELKETLNSVDISAEERQNAIFDRIRQNGSCRMKDIQEVFPDVSERTIRYDLQALVEKGLIERIGSSGPATYYRVSPV